MKNLREALIEQLKDLYSAETQLVEALPKMAKAVISPELKSAIENHLKETKEHVKRLEKIGKSLEEKLDGHVCKAMKGLIKEGEDVISEDYDDEALIDVQVVAAAQRVEHYEIAGYGNAIALAEYLDLGEASSTLQKTIEEEGNADKGLTKICQQSLFAACEAV